MMTANSIKLELFLSNERFNLLSLFNGCAHRYEFKQLIRCMHSENECSSLPFASLLRYVDCYQLKGIFSLMEYYSNGHSIESAFSPEYFQTLLK
ncbi:hypothetical protein EIJ81_03420 [Aliivibrio salmonicida]|uniref:Uncharacterized protein n=1 Tax=Aliivibrio salmonicida (strain LFI1238) TaxID=316275 RepID=B6ELL1_ALISL|nr:hypothetical protein [Aliivibrio salmonicida]AZL83839.1 hypothetical protein EIJ81_03420 [Aliivibrio salmonicida]CAQ78073.1 hypothetical protein, putative phage gene [Aliivibrio salmonicida LFI1238]